MQVGLEDSESFLGGVVGGGLRWVALLGAVWSGALEVIVGCRVYCAGEEFLNLVCVCLYWDGLSFEGIGEPVYFGRVSDDECFKGITESFLDFRGLEAVGVEGQP